MYFGSPGLKRKWFLVILSIWLFTLALSLIFLIFQCTQQRDYVLLAIQTPVKEEESNSSANHHTVLSIIDEEWTAAHARQVIKIVLL